MQSYLDDLDVELAQQPGFKAPPLKELTQMRTTSTTDSECGYIHHVTKRGILGATEECLLAATALNLKRMVKAIFFAFYGQFRDDLSAILCEKSFFQQVQSFAQIHK